MCCRYTAGLIVKTLVDPVQFEDVKNFGYPWKPPHKFIQQQDFERHPLAGTCRCII